MTPHEKSSKRIKNERYNNRKTNRSSTAYSDETKQTLNNEELLNSSADTNKCKNVKKTTGTRMTGAGSHGTKNRSIFHSLQPGILRKDSDSPSSRSNLKEKRNPRKAHIYAKLTRDDGLLIFFSKTSEPDEFITEKDLKEGEIIALSTLWKKGTMSYKSLMKAKIFNIGSSPSKDGYDNRKGGTSSSLSTGWIPLEGIYGVYMLPSGPHLVLIVESEQTYKSPYSNSFPSSSMNLNSQLPLLNIRRIRSMEIVALPPNKKQQVPTAFIMRQNEAQKRQLSLFRQSFKDHDFYFIPPRSPANMGDIDLYVVKDITHTLQRSFLHWTHFVEEEKRRVRDGVSSEIDEAYYATKREERYRKNLNNSNGVVTHKQRNMETSTQEKNSWWFPLFTQLLSASSEGSQFSDCRPDSRFLWNEEGLRPFIEHMMPSVSNDNSSLFCILANHVIPVTSAFIGVQRQIPLAPDALKGTSYSVLYDQLLISRRSKLRAGTRFTRRGSDRYGDVANYVETEQICIILNKPLDRHRAVVQELYAHVQTRGSIPLRWSSPADVKTYRPRVLIGTDPLAQTRALRGHLVEQLSIYSSPQQFSSKNDKHNELLFVNLIDKKSDQGRLGRTFDAVLKALLDSYNKDGFHIKESNYTSILEQRQNRHINLLCPDVVGHEWFDFHAECKGGRWKKLRKLLDDVAPVLDSQGYFCVTSNIEQKDSLDCLWKILRLQCGIVRTNCMDCLDRTNVVQSIFGRYMMYQQLQERIGLKIVDSIPSSSIPPATTEYVLGRKLPIEYVVAFKNQRLRLPWKHGEVSHRWLWADNADAISTLYAGTPALKGDFTRTGKRTKRGALDDGVNSLQRYYLNNFLDADRQEGIDLLVGYAKFDAMNKDNVKQREGLKIGKGSFQPGRNNSYGGIHSSGSRSDRLNLYWLPGDLQSHLRGAALSSASSTYQNRVPLNLILGSKGLSDPSVAKSLKEIDRRASFDQPWWVLVDDSSGFKYAATVGRRQTLKREGKVKDFSVLQATLSTSASGHILGSLIAATQAPLATAVIFVLFVTSLNNNLLE